MTVNNPKVAVVGGGPGGLFCAYLLSQKVPNANICIYESSDHLGGKIKTDRFSDGSRFEAGVAELYEYLGPEDDDSEDPLRCLIEKDLGLETYDMLGRPIMLQGKLTHNYDDIVSVHGEEVQKRILNFYAKCAELMPLEKYANRWQPDNEHPWANKTFRECIKETLMEGMGDKYDHIGSIARDYIETAVASDLATESHTCNGLNGIKNCLMDNDKYMQVYHVVGGISLIVKGLRKRLLDKGVTFYLNSRVCHVGREGGTSTKDKEYATLQRSDSSDSSDSSNWSVVYEETIPSSARRYTLSFRTSDKEQSKLYDAIFLCLPNHWLTQLNYEGEELKEAIHRILSHYDLPAHYLRVSFLFSEPFWEKHNLPNDFWMMDCLNGCCCYNEAWRWRDHPSGGNILSILMAGQDALLMVTNNQTDEDILDYTLDVLPDLLRDDAKKYLLEGQVDKFVGSINAQPGGWPSKDLVTEHRPEPNNHPNLYLVGDYLFDSTLNAALMSANTATNLYMQALGLDYNDAKLTEAVEELGGLDVPLSTGVS